MPTREFKNIDNANVSEIFSEKVSILYRNTTLSLFANFAVSVIIVNVLWNVCIKNLILSWFFVNLIILGARAFSVYKFNICENKIENARYWEKIFSAGALLSGISLGLTGFIILPGTDLIYRSFLILAIGGMTSGALGVYSVILRSFIAYSGSAVSLIIVSFLVKNDPMNIAIAVMIIVYLAVMVATAKKMRDTISYTLHLKVKNHELISRLRDEKEQTEKLNEKLSKEVEERKIIARELEKSNKTKDQFFSIIAHDLRSPLSSFMGISELLYKEIHDIDKDTIDELLASLHNSAINVFNLLENLLDWATSQTQSIKYNITKIDISTTINNTLPLLEHSAEKKHIFMFSEVEKETFVKADKNMVYTIIRNLVSNAIKFTNKQGEIKISATHKGENIEIAVSDTGVGIDHNVLQKLFDSNKTHSTSGTANEKGTGLGIKLCKDFVEKNNGKLWVESEVNKGTTFYFTLPAA